MELLGMIVIESSLFFVITAILLLVLRKISYYRFKSDFLHYLYIIFLAGFIGGNYFSIFRNGDAPILWLLGSYCPDYRGNVLVTFSSLAVCFLLSFCVPKMIRD